MILDLDAYESFDDKYLKEVKAQGDDLGIQIHAGSWSIFPTSKVFKSKWGTAEETQPEVLQRITGTGYEMIW